ncbi:CDP-alcohol phosphatidyltransferase family protein [bacterium]|nr:CDP-alcohol phosphatidyltransferase family protein [FCB group bacterium]MBL7191822.1 CDP-alcohol phosphatidyltransferase family protein [bacterium]
MPFTLSNILTTTRLIIVPIFLYCFLSDKLGLEITSTFLFIIGALTDHYDGKLARKRKEVTEFGRFTDPLADKFLIMGAFTAILIKVNFGGWFISVLICVILIALREFGLTVMRLWAISKKTPLITSFWGKFKTTFQLIAIIFSLVYLNVREILVMYNVQIKTLNDSLFIPIIHFLIVGSMLVTVISGVLYLSASSFEKRVETT